MAITAADLQVEVGSDTGKAEAGLARVERRMDKTSQRLNGLGKSMRRTGGRMTKFLTAPLLAAGAASVKMAADFESEMAKIQGLVGASEKQVESYKDAVLGMSTEVGKSPQELAEALFFIESAGLEGQKALDALRASAKASAGGLGETKSVANAVTSAMNAYGHEVLSSKEATDILVATVREGKAEASELAPQFGQMMQSATELGVGFEELGGGLAFLTKATGEASLAGTAMRGVLRAIIKPTQSAKDALDKVGMTFDELQEQVATKGLLPTLRALRGEFDEAGVRMSDLFQDSEGLQGALALTGDQAETAERIFGNLAEATGATDKAFETASKTAKFQFDKAMASLSKTMVEAGSELLPLVADAAESLADGISDLVDWWSDLSDTQKKIVGSLAGVAAAAGPVLVVLGMLASSLSKVITLFGATKAAGATGAATRFAGALGRVRGLLIGGLAFGGTVAVVNELVNSWRDATAATEEWVDAVIDSSRTAEEAVGTIDERLEAHKEEVTGAGTAWSRFGHALTGPIGAFHNARNAVIDAAEGLALVRGRAKAANAEFDRTGDILPSVKEAVDNLNDPLSHLPPSLRNAADGGGPAAQAVQAVGDEAADAAMGVEEFEDALNSLFEPALNLERATIAYQDQLIELNRTLADNKATFDLASEAGKKNRSAVLDSVEAARDHAVAMINDGKSVDAATQAMQQHVVDLKKQLRQAGHSEQAIQSYIDTLNLTPGDIKTTLQAETSQAEAQVRSFQSVLEEATRDREITVTATRRMLTGGIPTGHAGGIVGDLPLTAGFPTGDEQMVKARKGERLLTQGQNEAFERLIGVLQSQGGGQRETVYERENINIFTADAQGAARSLAEENRDRAYLRGR